jgi:hypothetical protein
VVTFTKDNSSKKMAIGKVAPIVLF